LTCGSRSGPAIAAPFLPPISVANSGLGAETMGINADWLGYLRFWADFAIGRYDLAGIEVRGEKIETVRRKYLLHRDIERQLEWVGPMTDLPRNLG
jgi:hypothetical protein